jgi:hypothetical protein
LLGMNVVSIDGFFFFDRRGTFGVHDLNVRYVIV